MNLQSLHKNSSSFYIASIIVVIFTLFVSSVFFVGQTKRAAEKHFWLDERYGMENIRRDSYAKILIDGAGGQGSPSPLDYIALKVMDEYKQVLNIFDFNDRVYLRLWANGVTTFIGLFVFVLFICDIKNSNDDAEIKLIQLALLTLVPIAFYFHRNIYYYAAEMRPYALWNSLYFLVLSILLLRQKKERLLTGSLIFLSLSATSSAFQIAVMALAYSIVSFVERKSVKDVVKKVAKIFLLPISINIYYSLHSGKWNYFEDHWGTWEHFSEFWYHESVIIPMMLVVIVSAFLKRENRFFAIAPMAFLFLYVIGPIIFYLTRLKGFLYAERQYIYYDLINVVFLLALVQIFPAFVKDVSSNIKKIIIVVLVVGIGCSTALRKKPLQKFNESINHTCFVMKTPKFIKR